MSLKCCASFSKSIWCIINTSVSSVCTGGLLQLQMHQMLDLWRQDCNTRGTFVQRDSPNHTKPDIVLCTECWRQVDTRDQTEEGRCWLRQCMRGWVMTTRDRGPRPIIQAHLLVCSPTNGVGNTHTADSSGPLSPSLTSSFSLLPSYCVGGNANGKVRVSKRGRAKKQHGKVIQSSCLHSANCKRSLSFIFEHIFLSLNLRNHLTSS